MCDIPPSIVEMLSPSTRRVQPYVLAVQSIKDLQKIYSDENLKFVPVQLREQNCNSSRKGECTYLEQRRQSEVKHKLQVWVRKAMASKI